jgi:hypothetical protein
MAGHSLTPSLECAVSGCTQALNIDWLVAHMAQYGKVVQLACGASLTRSCPASSTLRMLAGILPSASSFSWISTAAAALGVATLAMSANSAAPPSRQWPPPPHPNEWSGAPRLAFRPADHQDAL